MNKKLGRTIHPQRGWELLKKLNYRSYVPRPRHAKADLAAQETFQNLPEALEDLRTAHPERDVEV